jgi:5-formyltetrahydrofolate cyclo-ligase
LQASPRPKHPKLVGLSYELQKLSNINPEPWDVDLDAVFTENGIYQRNLT